MSRSKTISLAILATAFIFVPVRLVQHLECQVQRRKNRRKDSTTTEANTQDRRRGRKVKERWAEHKSSMENPYTKTPVGKHFQERGHRGAEDCTILPFMKIWYNDPNVRLMEKKAI